MKCSSCGSFDVRLSKRHSTFSFVNQIKGLERYRCRECRHSFWEKPPSSNSEKIRRKRARAWSPFFQTRGRRAFIEMTLFVVMLVVFFFTIRYLVSKSEPPGPVGSVRPLAARFSVIA